MKLGEVPIGKKIKWEDIEIQQPFYFEGCFGLGIKTTDDHWMDIDYKGLGPSIFGIGGKHRRPWSTTLDDYFKFYELPADIEEAIRPL